LIPRLLAQPVGWVAAASMWIFMTHWVVWPELTPLMPDVLAMVATVGAGVGVWAAWRAGRGAWVKSAPTIRHAERFRMVERPAL
jgi:hypothetical protein